jgi:hypothetical protein
MRVLTPIRMPAKGWPFVQLPAGEYALIERGPVHYEVPMSDEFSCYFRLAELESLRAAGDLVIAGQWPQ